jgi:hypothetical protein
VARVGPIRKTKSSSRPGDQRLAPEEARLPRLGKWRWRGVEGIFFLHNYMSHIYCCSMDDKRSPYPLLFPHATMKPCLRLHLFSSSTSPPASPLLPPATPLPPPIPKNPSTPGDAPPPPRPLKALTLTLHDRVFKRQNLYEGLFAKFTLQTGP